MASEAKERWMKKYGDLAAGDSMGRQVQHTRRSAQSDMISRRIFEKAAEARRYAALQRKRRENQGELFPFARLPFDMQEYTLRFLPAKDIGRCAAVCREWRDIFKGTVAAIYAQEVGVAREVTAADETATGGATSSPRILSEIRLIHRLRHTETKENAVDMLLWGAKHGHNSFVARLLKSRSLIIDANVAGTSEQWDRETALHIAVRRRNKTLVQDLIHAGADTAVTNKFSETPLYIAAERGFRDITEVLLDCCKQKLDAVTLNRDGRSPLLRAVEKGRRTLVHMLLDAHTTIDDDGKPMLELDVNVSAPDVGTPLCVACKNGETKLAIHLLDAGGHVNAASEDGRTPLYFATEKGSIPCIKALMERRPPVTDEELKKLKAEAKQTRTDPDAPEMLIPNVLPERQGVIIDFMNETGKTPLFAAAEKGMGPIVQLLLGRGSNPSKPTHLNKTPLYSATENSHRAVVEILLKVSTLDDVNKETNYGTTALFMAQRNGQAKIADMITAFMSDELEKKRKARKKKFVDADGVKKLSKSVNRLSKKKKKVATFRKIRDPVEKLEQQSLRISQKVENSKDRLKRLKAEMEKKGQLRGQGRLAALETSGEVASKKEAQKAERKLSVDSKSLSEASNHEKLLRQRKERGSKASTQESPYGKLLEASSKKRSASVKKRKKKSNAKETVPIAVPLVGNEGNDLPGAWAWGILAGQPLRALHESLLRYSRATSSYKMPSKLFRKVFGVRKESADRVFDRFASQSFGEKGLCADAWEVFVVASLFANAPVRERLRFCFGLFDMKRSGTIQKDMLGTMLRCCTNGVRKVLNDKPTMATSSEVKTLTEKVLAFRASAPVSSDTANPAQGDDGSLPDTVDTESFVEWAVESPEARSFNDAFQCFDALYKYSKDNAQAASS